MPTAEAAAPIYASAKKAAMRRAMRARRAALDPEARGKAAAEMARHVAALSWLDGPVAGYIAVGAEADPLPAMARFAGLGRGLALPVVVAPDRPLVFRGWRLGAPLAKLAGLWEPPAAAPMVTPVVVVTPLVAFDRRGWRLGQGGGFYDRTLALLRASGPVLAVGFAFGAQEVDAVPTADGDQRLDAVVTEDGWREFG